MSKLIQLQINKATYHKWLAGLCLLVAYLSPAKFPGLPGWLGAGGLLLLAATFFTTPQLSTATQSRPHIAATKYVLIAVSLALVVASVVVWSVER